MPVATVDPNATRRFDLETAPPDGYVVVRKMSYGQYLHRRDMAAKMMVEAPRGKRSDMKATVDMVQTATTLYEFQKCIVEHNLEHREPNGTERPLNLTDAKDFSLLDPLVGQEIQKWISELNQFQKEDDEGTFPGSSSVDSSE